MKTLHWIVFGIAAWITIGPFILDDLLATLYPVFDQSMLIDLLRWDDLILGLGIAILALIAVMLERTSHKHPGLKSMHWFQVMIGLWIALAPFVFTFTYETFTISHLVAGGMMTIYALLQLVYETD